MNTDNPAAFDLCFIRDCELGTLFADVIHLYLFITFYFPCYKSDLTPSDSA